MRSVTVRAARWSATHPWRAMLLWLVFVAAAVGTASAVPVQQLDDDDTRIGQSGVADEIISDSGLTEPLSENVLITSADGELDRDSAESAASDVRQQMSQLPEVGEVGRPVWSEDGAAVLVPLRLTTSDDVEAEDDIQALLDVTDDVQAEHPDLVVEQSGDASLNQAIWEQVSDDLAASEKLSLPIAFGIMLLAFAALIAAAIPVLLALTSVMATFGIYAAVSSFAPDNGSVMNIVLLLGMAVGVDYSLFYLKREREERRRGHSTVDAVEIAAATSGRSIVVSGIAVIVAMAGMYVTGVADFISIATGAIIVVGVAVLGSITVLPALLAKLGRWVDRPRVPLLWRVSRRIGPGGVSRRILAPVMRHPGAALVVSTVALGALAAPALGMKIDDGGLTTLPKEIPTVQTLQRTTEHFPSEGTAYDIAVRTTPERMPDTVAALNELATKAESEGDFVTDSGEGVQVSDDKTAAVMTLVSPTEEGNDASVDALNRLRDDLVPQYLDPVDAQEQAVGGGVAESQDFAQNQRDKLPMVLVFVLGLTLLMMGITFRSVMIALVTTVLNLFSAAAAFGVLALVFQHGWFESVLGFTAPGFAITWIPLFVFVILVGLSMDYHVFVLSRVRENLRRGLSPREAVRAGVTETAGVVTSAAAVMVAVFGIFATLGMMEMKQMGVGLAAAILIDATIVRVVMLPSILALLGRAAWWPSGVGRRSAHRESPAVEEVPELVG
ncbi:MAG TPA: MMPL family transporter [Nocardioidaceae bacterium]|nr:MMPL family transporter [Nocardioidaceae bacterium]